MQLVQCFNLNRERNNGGYYNRLLTIPIFLKALLLLGSVMLNLDFTLYNISGAPNEDIVQNHLT